MKSLANAIKARRVQGAPLPQTETPLQEGIVSAAPAEVQPEGTDVKQILESLGDEQKMELFEMLKMEMEGSQEESPEAASGDSGDESQMEDDAGSLKSTPGEKQALSGGMDMDVAMKLHDPRFTGDEEQVPRNLSERVKMNIAKALKRKG